MTVLAEGRWKEMWLVYRPLKASGQKLGMARSAENRKCKMLTLFSQFTNFPPSPGAQSSVKNRPKNPTPWPSWGGDCLPQVLRLHTPVDGLGEPY